MRRFEIPGDNVFPEGITEGPGTTFFVGSMTDGTIYRGDTTTGEVAVFLPPDGDGRGNICGMDVDGYGRLISCDFEGGRLFVHDLASRRLVASRKIPAAEALPNDVVVVGDSAYVTDTKRPIVWRLPAGPGAIGEPEPAIDLTPFGPADPAYLNGIAAHPDGTHLLVGSQGEGGTLWLVDLAASSAAPVDLGGYEFNADGMLLDGDVLYGVTNRGESWADIRFMVSAVRLAPDLRSGTILGQLTDPSWDGPTTLAKVDDILLVVCAQIPAMHAQTPPDLPFMVAATSMPSWP
jgi:Cu-Zn family superoxide dismutase